MPHIEAGGLDEESEGGSQGSGGSVPSHTSAPKEAFPEEKKEE